LIFRETLGLAKKRLRQENDFKRRRLALQERTLLLRELEAGGIRRKEYCAERGLIAVHPQSSPQQAGSSDWDLEELNKDMGRGAMPGSDDWDSL